MRPGRLACAAACRDGRRASSVRSSFSSAGIGEYQRLGDAAIAVIGDFTPLVERISIDEAFADVAGCTHLFGPPAEIASAIRRRVRAELGLPISIGVACTKHLAKIASQVAKPDGLVVVDPGTELNFLHRLPVELMWGVGPATKERLEKIGVRTIGQLANTPGWSLERLLGPAAGEKLAALPGIAIPAKSSLAAAPDRPARNRRSAKSLPSRKSFGQPCFTSPTASPPGSAPSRGPAEPCRSAFASPICVGRPVGHARRTDFRNHDPRRDRRRSRARGPRRTPQ